MIQAMGLFPEKRFTIVGIQLNQATPTLAGPLMPAVHDLEPVPELKAQKYGHCCGTSKLVYW
jgi:hypothetical protein